MPVQKRELQKQHSARSDLVTRQEATGRPTSCFASSRANLHKPGVQHVTLPLVNATVVMTRKMHAAAAALEVLQQASNLHAAAAATRTW